MPVYPCKHPTCNVYVARRGDYCDAHVREKVTARARKNDANRRWTRHYDKHLRNPKARTFYDSAAWDRARAAKLAATPICERCQRQWARHVHHRKPLEECSVDEKLAQSNLLSLCATCHNLIESELARPDAGRRTVVCGPPASGKTTWVAERRRVGDVVWDYDVVCAAITGRALYDRPANLIGLFEVMRVAAVEWLAAHVPPSVDVFVIVSDPQKAAAIATSLNAELVTLDVAEDVCVQRIAGDEQRQRRDEQVNNVRRWFARQVESLASPSGGKSNG